MRPDSTITIPLYTWKDIRKRLIAKRIMKKFGGTCTRLNKHLVYTLPPEACDEFFKRLLGEK